jgi:hypothetical protein
MIAAANPATIPPGLAERIDALLCATPATWPDEPCVLELEPEIAAVAQLLAAQGRGVEVAEQLLHTHQQGNADATYRIEYRTGGIRSVVAYLTEDASLRQELARHGARLRTAAATGELVLVEQASLDELAHLPLGPEPGSGNRPS